MRIKPSNQSFWIPFFVFLTAFFVLGNISVYAQRGDSPYYRLQQLERQVNALQEKVRLLEAITNELQQKYPPGSIQALQQLLVERNKDGILNELNHLASSAYQFRIRPETMGGGGGGYVG